MKQQICTGSESLLSSQAPNEPFADTYFTLRSAQVLIPELRMRLRKLRDLARQLWERRREMHYLLTRANSTPGCTPRMYQEEWAAAVKHLEHQWELLKTEVVAVRQLGVLPRSIVDGVVDFPCVIHDRRVFLCWQVDEPTILYWHPVGAGFSERLLLHDLGSPLWEFSGSTSFVARSH